VTVAVEIEQTDIVDHPHSFKEMQKLNINIDNNWDTFRVTILNPDDGEFIMNFQDTEDLTEYHSTWPITANGNLDHMWSKFSSYCGGRFGTWCRVAIEMYDDQDVITLDPALTVKNVITVELMRLITGPSTNNILIAKTSTASTITVELPSEVQLSSTPLNGKYQIKCLDADGFTSLSQEIEWWHSANTIAERIFNGCDQFYDRLEVWETGVPDYRQNGIELIIKFQGLNADPGQFEVVSVDTDPLQGDNILLTWETVTPYSTNLWYEPVPFEMLKTYETKPQIIVSVDGQPAVCHGLNCDYTYVAAVG